MNKLKGWLNYLESLPIKIKNIFADAFRNLDNSIDLSKHSTINDKLQQKESISDILSNRQPLLQDEVAFLFEFINYGYHSSGIVKQESRPDGGRHVVSEYKPAKQNLIVTSSAGVV